MAAIAAAAGGKTAVSFDVLIVGGGAAGLCAAAVIGRMRPGARVCVCEKQPRVGKKLLATGNGTCNLTNIAASAAHYHGAPALAQAVLEACPVRETLAFFTAIGVDPLVREDGRVYPYAEQAGAVLDALRLEAAARGAETRTGTAVTALHPQKGGLLAMAETPDGAAELFARQVLVCTGGAAAPALGGSAEAYRLLTDLGLRRTPLSPSIVQLRTDTTFVRALKGIRVDAAATLCLDGRTLAAQTGEVLFTEYGLSGPAIMQISRPAGVWERRPKGRMTVLLDLLPDWDPARLMRRLTERAAMPGRTLEDLFTGLLNKRLGQTVLRMAGAPSLTEPVERAEPALLRRAGELTKAMPFAVQGTKGFGGAQVTAGGIDAVAIDPCTMGVRGIPGLYAAGEVLDVDGDCGGFNLQFAFGSATVAARAICAAMKKG